MARARVTTAGRPSGTAATARLTAQQQRVDRLLPCEPECEHQNHDRAGRQCEPAHQYVESLLERCLAGIGAPQQPGESP